MPIKNVRAEFKGERISFKESMKISDTIRKKTLKKAKNILKDLLDKKITLDGKQMPKTTHAFLTLLKSAEANAKQKNMDTEKLFIRIIKADRGFRYIRPKSLAKYRGREAKITNISVILEEN